MSILLPTSESKAKGKNMIMTWKKAPVDTIETNFREVPVGGQYLGVISGRYGKCLGWELMEKLDAEHGRRVGSPITPECPWHSFVSLDLPPGIRVPRVLVFAKVS